MKHNIVIFFLIMIGCYLFSYTQNILTSGLDKYDTFVLPIFSMLYFGLILNATYFIGYKLTKSKIFFVGISWLVVVIFLIRSIEGAKNIKLTLIQFDQTVYDQGSITLFGVFFEIIDPFLLMALFATYIFIKTAFKSKN